MIFLRYLLDEEQHTCSKVHLSLTISVIGIGYIGFPLIAKLSKNTNYKIVGFDREEKSDACELVSSITGDNSRNVVSFGTEAGLFQEIGISTVVCGPGSIEQAHKVDEFIELNELKKCLKFLEGIKSKAN